VSPDSWVLPFQYSSCPVGRFSAMFSDQPPPFIYLTRLPFDNSPQQDFFPSPESLGPSGLFPLPQVTSFVLSLPISRSDILFSRTHLHFFLVTPFRLQPCDILFWAFPLPCFGCDFFLFPPNLNPLFRIPLFFDFTWSRYFPPISGLPHTFSRRPPVSAIESFEVLFPSSRRPIVRPGFPHEQTLVLVSSIFAPL